MRSCLKEKPLPRLAAAFLALLAACFLLNLFTGKQEKPYRNLQLEAAERTDAAFSAIRNKRLSEGASFSLTDDPCQTGMIGLPYSDITTTLGNLESKRSTANPNVAAMVMDLLIQCGVREGDTVAVSLSSSFPCLNLAVLCSLDTLGARGIIINSVGSSTYGANDPDFTYLDMEHLLLEQGLISNHSQWFSMGGSGDQGREMPDEVKAAIQKRLSGYGLSFLDYQDLDENVAARTGIYLSGQAPVCFVNAGGNLLAFAGGTELIASQNGILYPKEGTSSGDGLIPFFLGRGVPVIHLLNMKDLLPSYGLPVDPIPLPEVGEGGVYYEEQLSPVPAAVICACLSLVLWALFRNFPCRRLPV